MSTNYTFPMCHLAAPRATLFFLWSKKKTFWCNLMTHPPQNFLMIHSAQFWEAKVINCGSVWSGNHSETIALLCWNKDFCFNFKGRRLFHQIVTKAIFLFLWMISACNLIQRSNSVGRQECWATRLRSNGRFRWILTIASLFWNSCKGKQLKREDRVVYLDFGLAEAFL